MYFKKTGDNRLINLSLITEICIYTDDSITNDINDEIPYVIDFETGGDIICWEYKTEEERDKDFLDIRNLVKA